MTSSLKNMSDGFLNIQSDGKALSSVWATLCANYEGINIKNTVSQLLQMYRPEDGIEAYERLLKTLIVLLEDCNNNDLRSFTSMIPPPVGFSTQIIKEIFFNATGFTRIDEPIFQQNYFYVAHDKNLTKNRDKLKGINNFFKYSEVDANDFVNSEAISVPKVTNQHIIFPQKLSNDCHSFQELQTLAQTVYTHDKNIQYPPHNLDCNHYPNHQYFMKHQSNSVYLPSMNFQKNWSLNQVPLYVKNSNTIQSNFPCRSLLVKTMNNKYLKLPITSCNVPDVHYFNHYQNQQSSEIEKNLTNASNSLSSNILQNIIEVSGTLNNVEHKEESLKKEGFNNFEEYNFCSLEKEKIESNDEKTNNQFFLPLADNILETLTVNKSLKTCIGNFLNRLKQDVSAKEQTNETQSINTFIETQKSSLPHYRRTISSPFSQRKNNLQNELKTTNSNSVHQLNSINELTVHKQQYYDALRNIQRAKMAVVNSLTLSSIQSYGDFDSFYTNYEQQRPWNTPQCQTKIINESPNCQKLFYPQYSRANDPYIRSVNWNTSYSSSRIQQEFPLHTSPMYGSRYMYNFSNNTSQYSDLSSKNKSTAKKRKLNNTTVKLTKMI